MRKIYLIRFIALFVFIQSFTSCKQNSSALYSGDPVQNVIVIIGDDHSTKVLGSYGNKIIRTPNLDKLASGGIQFSNAYANAPLCSASRQSILTGKYPHSTGVTLLRTPFRDEGNTTVAEILREEGFRTAIIGKSHFNNYMDSVPPDHGFEYIWSHKDYLKWFAVYGRKVPDSISVRPDWRPFQDPSRIWLNADMLPGAFFEGDGTADLTANKAIEFIQNHSDERFCLWVGFDQPHSPFDFPLEYRGKYDPDEILLPAGSKEDDRWIPAVFRDLSDEDKKGIIASYYTSVEYMDQAVGKILDAVDESGLEDETLIIYMGDQGYLLNDHKRFEKHTMWEYAIKAPLIIKAGEKIRRKQVNTKLTEFIDLAPTILEILGFRVHPQMQGKSLVPQIEGNKSHHKEYVFAEFLCDNKAMVANDEWKYIFASGKSDLGQGYATGYGPSGIVHKLYQLKNDPGETTNVSSDPDNSQILIILQEQMLKIFKETHPYADQLPEGLNREKSLVWFCDPPEKMLKKQKGD